MSNQIERVSLWSKDQRRRNLMAWRVAQRLTIFLRLGKNTSGKIPLCVTIWVCSLSSNLLWRNFFSLSEHHQNHSSCHINLKIRIFYWSLKSSRCLLLLLAEPSWTKPQYIYTKQVPLNNGPFISFYAC